MKPVAKNQAGGDELIGAAEVGRLLGGAGKRKLRALVARGEFASYAFGGRTVYSRDEVAAFIERVKAKGPGRAPWKGYRAVASAGTAQDRQ